MSISSTESRDHVSDLFSFKSNNTKKENNMIKQSNIERLEVTTRWVSVAASVVLLGLQVTRLIKSPKEDPAVDESEE